ncbi:paraquat-inducible protein B [Sulfitobacter alexandrii]|uniref:Paraquat-inducible protein B n=1 Tax=Sulfitobacter alexandrii TaxID=1917485 RepID=A0A1J0WCF6_9RHOB|nr:MlaD family protein [Sulfitobacter alexandrii]APE41999.1 paraquat-inducible protein B [Sulfitobacter alexandrii]
MNDELPDVSVSPVRKVFFSGASFVWILPVLALVVALGVAWQSYNSRGPLIVVEFENGAGIKAGETELRYRDITVGTVEEVGFTEGLGKVLASIRVAKDVAPYIDSGAVFWIVQPEVTAQGITGLSTVLSGVHIEGSWDDQIGSAMERFTGASEPPLIRSGRGGLEIAFRTVANGQLTDNAPILFKGIEVGRVGRAKIAPRGNFAIVEALIFEEHRTLINENTRFWDASGFTVNIGPAGAEIDFSSLATLVGGGITFDTFVSGGGPVQDGSVFEIFPDKESARNSLFNASEVDPLKLSVVFEDNIAGLATGAPVEMSGLKIGEVEALSGVVDYDLYGDNRVRLNVNLSIQPARLGLPGDVTADNALAFLQERVEGGLRARLASASLLTGGLKIELVDVPDAPEAQLVSEENLPPRLPTTESEVSDAAATVEGVFNRINSLPIEELLNSAITFLDSAEALVSDDALRETPQDVRNLLAEIQGLVASDDVRNIPVALNATLSRVETLVAELQEQQLAAKLVDAIDTVAVTADSVSTSIEGVPDLIAEIRSVAQKAEALQVEELIAEVTALVDTAETVIGSEEAAALPVALKDAVDQVNATLRELRDGGAVRDINQTLASARQASANIANATDELPEISARISRVLDDAATAVDTVNSSVAGVPQLIARFEAVANKAESLEVEELLAELTELTRTADELIGTEDAKALPGSLKRALDEVNYTLQELREGGAIDNVNQTLASARNAADTIAVTARDLPQIVERLTRLFAQASQTIQGYDRGEQLSRTAQDTLRDIQKAADALTSLARTIERNPNSLLLGR